MADVEAVVSVEGRVELAGADGTVVLHGAGDVTYLRFPNLRVALSGLQPALRRLAAEALRQARHLGATWTFVALICNRPILRLRFGRGRVGWTLTPLTFLTRPVSLPD